MTVTAELADGRRLEFPDGTDPGVVQSTVKKLLGGANKSVPDSEGAPDSSKNLGKPNEDGFLARARGAVEAAANLLVAPVTAAVGGAGGALGALAGSVRQGEFGTSQAAQRVQQGANEGAAKLALPGPQTETGQGLLEDVGKAVSGLPPVPTQPAVMARAAAPVLQQAAKVPGAAVRGAERAGMALNDRLAAAAEKVGLKGGDAEMVGVGAAETAPAAMRRARAADLPVPIKLTKGQAERTFEQQQFERETAKNPDAGKPLRERYADQNAKILQNFDAWVDQTGAQAGSLRATGEAVDKAVVAKAASAKGRINAAYDQARKAGDMAELVDVAPLQKYLIDHEPEAVNAGVLSSARMKLDKLAQDGKLSVNDLEEVRKMVGNLGGKDATNAHFAGELRQQIDALTEGRGGDAYKRARSLRSQYAKEFEDVGVVDKLLSKKPGTSDRAVAYEDVFQHSVMKGSLDDVRAIRKTLQTGGNQGQQAWRELQGATVKHLKDEITKNVATDQAGNRVVSPAKLNTLVEALDKDGKLDVIFGKKGAQQIRDVRDLAQDVYTAPPGSVNTSNTASILIGLLDTAVSGTAGMPLPIGTAANYAVKKVKARALNKRVGEALRDPDQPQLLKDAFDAPPAATQEPLRKAIGE